VILLDTDVSAVSNAHPMDRAHDRERETVGIMHENDDEIQPFLHGTDCQILQPLGNNRQLIV